MKSLTLIVNGFCIPFSDGAAVTVDLKLVFHFLIDDRPIIFLKMIGIFAENIS